MTNFAKRRLSCCAAGLLAALLVTPGFTAPAWYYGTVKRVFLYSGGFVLTVNSAELDDCQHKYVYLRTSEVGEKQVDRMLSVALAAQASGRTLGVVIDKSINGPGGLCLGTSMDIQD